MERKITCWRKEGCKEALKQKNELEYRIFYT